MRNWPSLPSVCPKAAPSSVVGGTYSDASMGSGHTGHSGLSREQPGHPKPRWLCAWPTRLMQEAPSLHGLPPAPTLGTDTQQTRRSNLRGQIQQRRPCSFGIDLISTTTSSPAVLSYEPDFVPRPLRCHISPRSACLSPRAAGADLDLLPVLCCHPGSHSLGGPLCP